VKIVKPFTKYLICLIIYSEKYREGRGEIEIHKGKIEKKLKFKINKRLKFLYDDKTTMYLLHNGSSS